MKRKYELVIALTVGILIVVYAAHEYTESTRDPRPGGMPVQVYTAFAKRYPNSGIKRWKLTGNSQGDMYPIVECWLKAKDGGKYIESTIDSSGSFILDKFYYRVPEERVPRVVLQSARKQFAMTEIDKVVLVSRNGTIRYYVHLKPKNTPGNRITYMAVCAKDGSVLEQRSTSYSRF